MPFLLVWRLISIRRRIEWKKRADVALMNSVQFSSVRRFHIGADNSSTALCAHLNYRRFLRRQKSHSSGERAKRYETKIWRVTF